MLRRKQKAAEQQQQQKQESSESGAANRAGPHLNATGPSLAVILEGAMQVRTLQLISWAAPRFTIRGFS